MKAKKDFRERGVFNEADDTTRKATKLDPIRKSGKERRNYGRMDDDDDDVAEYRTKRESAFDYFDDAED